MRKQRNNRRNRKTKYIVAVFRVDQQFGGPEEGGWWYSVGHPIREQHQHGGNVTFYRQDAARKYAYMLTRLLQETSLRNRYDEYEIRARVCENEVLPFPQQRPYYC